MFLLELRMDLLLITRRSRSNFIPQKSPFVKLSMSSMLSIFLDNKPKNNGNLMFFPKKIKLKLSV